MQPRLDDDAPSVTICADAALGQAPNSLDGRSTGERCRYAAGRFRLGRRQRASCASSIRYYWAMPRQRSQLLRQGRLARMVAPQGIRSLERLARAIPRSPEPALDRRQTRSPTPGCLQRPASLICVAPSLHLAAHFFVRNHWQRQPFFLAQRQILQVPRQQRLFFVGSVADDLRQVGCLTSGDRPLRRFGFRCKLESCGVRVLHADHLADFSLRGQV